MLTEFFLLLGDKNQVSPTISTEVMRFLKIMHDEWYQAAATKTSGDAQGNVGNPGTNSSLYLKSLTDASQCGQVCLTGSLASKSADATGMLASVMV
jgi:hypothetical protein